MNKSETRTPLVPFAVVAVGAFVLYVATPARWHTWDAIAYTARIYGNDLLSERFASTAFFHPHHLLFNALGTFVVGIQSILPGGTRDPFLPLQMMNALFGAASVWLLAAVAYRQSSEVLLAASAALIFALAQAVWRFATEVEVMIPTIFFVLLATWCATGLEAGSRRGRPVLVAIFAALAVLLHQIAALFCVALVVLLALNVRRGRLRGGQLGIVLVVLVVAVAGTYAAAGFGEHRSVAGFVDWLFFARSRSTFQPGLVDTSATAALKGYFHAFVSAYGLRGWHYRGATSLLPALSSLIAIAGVSVVSVVAALSLARRELRTSPFTIAALVWLLLVAAFTFWFEPYNIEYWIYALPPVLLLFVQAARRGRRPWLVPVAAVFLLSLGAVNLRSSIAVRMNEANADYWPAVTIVKRHMRPGDAILVGADAAGVMPENAAVAVPFLTGVDIVDATRPGDVAMMLVRVLREKRDVYIIGSVTGRLPEGYRLERVDTVTEWKVRRLVPIR